MKYFVIVDERYHTPVYFDHPDGRMLSLPLVTTQDVLCENFGQRLAGIECNGTRFVFEKAGSLSFTVCSDQGESEWFLRSQLLAIYHLLLLVFGPRILDTRRTNFLRYREEIGQLVDTATHLSDTELSALLDCSEALDVNEDIRNSFVMSLRASLRTVPFATHALILVRGKILAEWRRARAQPLDPCDVKRLATHMQAQLNPIVRDRSKVRDMPVADYRAIGSPPTVRRSHDTASTDERREHGSTGEGGDESIRNHGGLPGEGMTQLVAESAGVGAGKEAEPLTVMAGDEEIPMSFPGATFFQSEPAGHRKTQRRRPMHQARADGSPHRGTSLSRSHSAVFSRHSLADNEDSDGDDVADNFDGRSPVSSPDSPGVALIHSSQRPRALSLGDSYDEQYASAQEWNTEDRFLSPLESLGASGGGGASSVLLDSASSTNADWTSSSPAAAAAGAIFNTAVNAFSRLSPRMSHSPSPPPRTAADSVTSAGAVPPVQRPLTEELEQEASKRSAVTSAVPPSPPQPRRNETYFAPVYLRTTAVVAAREGRPPADARFTVSAARSLSSSSSLRHTTDAGSSSGGSLLSSSDGGGSPHDSRTHVQRRVYGAVLDRDITLLVVTVVHPEDGPAGGPGNGGESGNSGASASTGASGGGGSSGGGGGQRVASAAQVQAMLDTLHGVRRALCNSKLRSYGDFLRVRAEAALTMEPYLSVKFPGLLHFAFVDRSKARMVAPTFLSDEDDNGKHVGVRQRVWQMIWQAMDRLAEGSLSALLRTKTHTYSSRLWVEDSEGFELVVNRPVTARRGSNTPMDYSSTVGLVGAAMATKASVPISSADAASLGPGVSNASAADAAAAVEQPPDRECYVPRSLVDGFFAGLANHLFPGARNRGLRVFELYALYDSSLSIREVADCDRRLIHMLREEGKL